MHVKASEEIFSKTVQRTFSVAHVVPHDRKLATFEMSALYHTKQRSIKSCILPLTAQITCQNFVNWSLSNWEHSYDFAKFVYAQTFQKKSLLAFKSSALYLLSFESANNEPIFIFFFTCLLSYSFGFVISDMDAIIQSI